MSSACCAPDGKGLESLCVFRGQARMSQPPNSDQYLIQTSLLKGAFRGCVCNLCELSD